MEFTHKIVDYLCKGFEVGTPVSVIARSNLLSYPVLLITNGEFVKMCVESQIEEIKWN